MKLKDGYKMRYIEILTMVAALIALVGMGVILFFQLEKQADLKESEEKHYNGIDPLPGYVINGTEKIIVKDHINIPTDKMIDIPVGYRVRIFNSMLENYYHVKIDRSDLVWMIGANQRYVIMEGYSHYLEKIGADHWNLYEDALDYEAWAVDQIKKDSPYAFMYNQWTAESLNKWLEDYKLDYHAKHPSYPY